MLATIEFNSTRKRMTTVFRDLQTKMVRVMCKGADSIILPLLKDPDNEEVQKLSSKTVDFMDNFAREGLRTLLIVEKVLT